MTAAYAGDSAHTQVRRHIEHKVRVRELAQDVADRMVAALARGAAPDYAALLEAATFLPPPAVCYHTAPVAARDSIRADGLHAAAPVDGTWGDLAAGQRYEARQKRATIFEAIRIWLAEHPTETRNP